MSLPRETDYGTPKRESEQLVTLTIDGIEVSVPAGTSVMRAAQQANTAIPKLCATDSLEPWGSCRLCLVEIEGRRGYPASCTTPVEPGMVVRTQSSKLAELRRGVMELYISDHPLDCLTCSANGNCELQDMAGVVGLREVRYGMDGNKNHFDTESRAPVDTSNPYFSYDASKCIVCNRCVRACEETQGTFALTISGRGFESRVSPGQDQPFMDSECVSCGACVQACPTATLMEKSVIELGQAEKSVITTCAYCGVGCAFKAEMKGTEVVRMVPWKDGGANHGHSCVKGRFAWGYATHPDRITTPMIRHTIDEPWQKVGWEEAIAYAASEFRRIQARYGRGAVGGITSSRCTNEETYLVQKLVRAALGNNNVDTCARVCHSPTGYGLKQTLGESAGTQTFDSVMAADVVMVIGANPTDGHPVFGSQLKRRLRQGAKLIVADPREIDLLNGPRYEAAYHLKLRPGTNVALANALAHVIVSEGLVKEDSFRGLYCEGEDIVQSDPNTQHVEAALRAMECVVVQDLFLNETAKFAHVFLPGSSFLEKDGTFTNAERRISRVRKAIPPLAGKADWEVTVELAKALGYPMDYKHPSEIMDEIARLTPTFHGVSYEKLDRLGSVQWPCNEAAPEGTPLMHVEEFVRGKGRFLPTQYIATPEKVNKRYVQMRLAGIERDLPRGAPPKKVDLAQLVELTTQTQPEAATHWSTRKMAAKLGVHATTIWRHWQAAGLKPHVVRGFKVSRDPKFVEKLEDIVGLYMAPPEHALVLCCDEKSQVQALDRTQPGLPLKKGRAATLTHDDKRNGTTPLFAALNVLDGQLIG